MALHLTPSFPPPLFLHSTLPSSAAPTAPPVEAMDISSSGSSSSSESSDSSESNSDSSSSSDSEEEEEENITEKVGGGLTLRLWPLVS